MAALWHATLRRGQGTRSIEIDGMDFIAIWEGRVTRNEVCFDRSALAPLLTWWERLKMAWCR